MDLPETPITEIVLVMPPEGAKIVNYSARTKKPWKTGHYDGRYESMDTNTELITNDLSRDFYYEVQRSKPDQFYKESENNEEKSTSPKASSTVNMLQRELTESQKRVYDKLNASVKDTNMPIKKPKLYTVNPFCLPVSLIDLDTLQQ